MIDRLVRAGVRAILNYAPRAVQVPTHVHVRQIDPAAALQSMTYYLKNEDKERAADSTPAPHTLTARP